MVKLEILQIRILVQSYDSILDVLFSYDNVVDLICSIAITHRKA